MRILIGTTNPSKVEYFAKMLEGFGVEFITLRDLGVTDEPQETGRTPMENAKFKAAFYGQYADAVICADSGLYFDCLPLDSLSTDIDGVSFLDPLWEEAPQLSWDRENRLRTFLIQALRLTSV